MHVCCDIRDFACAHYDLIQVRAQIGVIKHLLWVRELFLEIILDEFRLPIRPHFAPGRGLEHGVRGAFHVNAAEDTAHDADERSNGPRQTDVRVCDWVRARAC